MGGGWGKRGSGVPLAQRVRGDLPPAQYDGRDPVGPDCPARHCWVSGAVDAEGVKRPGLLLEWRQVAGRWEGRVTYAARLRPLEANGGWLVVEEWLPAELLTLCDGARCSMALAPLARLGAPSRQSRERSEPSKELNRWSLGSPAVQQVER